MRRHSPSLFTLVALLAVLTSWHTGSYSQDLPVVSPPRPSNTGFALLGAGSCSAAACHNGAGSGAQGREYAVALERDPGDVQQRARDRHARAYEVLFESRAQALMRRLHPDDTSVRAEAETLCLRCHVNPRLDTNPLRLVAGSVTFQRSDGVSCEACHGPAERWLAAHFRAGWNALSAAQRQAQGQTDLHSIAGRVGVCVDCHIGAPGMDVNHDLLAAGHPRLRFEFASYHFLLHKHWDATRDGPDFEARAWPVGQLVAARAALGLLAERAATSDRQHPWPEFAAYDCAACHHDLGGARPAKRGTLVPSDWYTALVPEAMLGLGLTADATLGKALAEVESALASNRPERRLVAQRARHAVALLEERIAVATGKTVDPVALGRSLARADAGSKLDGDGRVQLAVARYLVQRPRNDVVGTLARLRVRALLQFPPARGDASLKGPMPR